MIGFVRGVALLILMYFFLDFAVFHVQFLYFTFSTEMGWGVIFSLPLSNFGFDVLNSSFIFQFRIPFKCMHPETWSYGLSLHCFACITSVGEC